MEAATSVAGIFAAGDATMAPGEQVLIEVGDGARAARSAHEYLLEGRLSGVTKVTADRPALDYASFKPFDRHGG